ncbi:MAG TPA: hypothetical protein PLG59_00560, partial [bacterium]|nr:hypothetical protein [bacterium]
MGFWAAALVVAKWIFNGKGFWAWLTRTILTTAAMFGLGKLLARSGGAKAEDIYVQGQGYGSPVKRVWGTMRIAGNLLWVWSKGIICNKNKSHPNNYYARFAIQICEGPIVGVKKIWFGPKLVFDD